MRSTHTSLGSDAPDTVFRHTLSPVHTSDNVAKNRDIVAETGNIVFLATMLPDCCRFRRQCRLCGRDYGDNVAGFGDIVAAFGDIVAVFGDNVAGVDGTLGILGTRAVLLLLPGRCQLESRATLSRPMRRMRRIGL